MERFPFFTKLKASASRRARRGGQGLLLGAAGVPGADGVGALGHGLVRVFNNRWEQITVHPRVSPRQSSTRRRAHLAVEKISAVERGAELAPEQGAPPRTGVEPLGRERNRDAGHRRGARAARALEPGQTTSLGGAWKKPAPVRFPTPRTGCAPSASCSSVRRRRNHLSSSWINIR